MKSPILLALLLASAAAAQPVPPPTPAAPVCPAQDVDLPAALAAWRTPVAASGGLRPGQTVQVALRPMAGLSGPVPPHSPLNGGAGMAAQIDLDVASAGAYELLLDRSAWVDLIQGSQALHPAGHGHGPACSTIHKTVDFQLAPGRYTIQLSGTTAAAVRLLVIPH